MHSIAPPPAPHLHHLLSTGLLLAVMGILGTAHAQQVLVSERTVASVEATATAEQALRQPAESHSPAVPTAPPGASSPATTTATEYTRQIRIGQATTQLMDLQRASRGQRPRPIDGEQASRSYLRYLKSFDTTIPEHYGTGLNTGAGSR